VARVAEYGNIKKQLNGEYENWQKCDPHSEQSPLNHAIGHAMEACELEYGSLERVWALAKASWNLLAQIWFEMEHRREVNFAVDQTVGLTESEEETINKWFEHKCAPTTYKR
jgi:hypothetical protein